LEMWECVREDLKDKDMGNEKNGRFLCQNALKNYTLVDLGEWTRDQWICDSVWEKGSMCVRCQNAKVAPSAMAWWES
jgi:hypothetical protein